MAEGGSVALAIERKGFKVVERTHVKTIVYKHKLVVTGMIGPKTAKKLGQISRVDGLVAERTKPFWRL